MSQNNPAHALRSHVFNIHFSITLSSYQAVQTLPAIQDFRVKIVRMFASTAIKQLLKYRQGKYFPHAVFLKEGNK
jgi:hypothetical protein